MIEDAVHTDDDTASLAPTEMPAMRGDTPVRARPLGPLALLPVMILFWFLPKRMGSRLAACGWIATFSVHVVATLVGLSLIAYVYLTTASVTYGNPMWVSLRVDMPDAEMTVTEHIRAPFVALVTITHGLSSQPTGRRIVLRTLVGIPVGLLLLAVLLMPFGAAGEWLGRLFGRCLRLTLWSTTLLLPLGIGWLVWPRFLTWADVDRGTSPPSLLFGGPPETNDQAYTMAIVALSIFGLWWLAVLLRSGLRYAGPADGPGWIAQPPRCMKCRYILAGLSLDGPCPECGTPVADSLEKQRKALKFTRWRAFVLSVKTRRSRCES